MVTEYDVISANDVAVLKSRVSDALRKGWQPFEGLQVCMPVVNGAVTPLYTQAMVKVAEPSQVEEEFLVK